MFRWNCFITLTFNDEALWDYRARGIPATDIWSVHKREWQLFMKRLRKMYGSGIRFYACGEYGEKHGRPHYHACVFNHEFKDKKLWRMSNGIPLFRSSSLELLWPFGYSSVGAVTFQSAAYVARYILKKVSGSPSHKHYAHTCSQTGLISQRQPEFVLMSRRPGLGRTWYNRFRDQVYPRDEVVVGGKVVKPPRYYDQLQEMEAPEAMLRIREERQRKAREHLADQHSDRLAVREEVKTAQIRKLRRSHE